MTRQMITDREFYNMGLILSEQLITQFDKDIIRGKLIAVYQGLMNNFRTEMRLSTSVIT